MIEFCTLCRASHFLGRARRQNAPVSIFHKMYIEKRLGRAHTHTMRLLKQIPHILPHSLTKETTNNLNENLTGDPFKSHESYLKRSFHDQTKDTWY